MQRILLTLTFPEPVSAHVPLDIAKSLYEVVEESLSIEHAQNFCRVNVLDDIPNPFDHISYGAKQVRSSL